MWWNELAALPARIAALAAAKNSPAIDPDAEIQPGAMLDDSAGPILIGPGTIVCQGATIRGPTIIGADCLIGNQAMVRGPVSIGDATRIGFATEIKNAIIADSVAIGPLCYVADSAIEREAYLGALVRTSNHRLDQRNVSVLIDGEAVDSGRDKLGCRIGARAAIGIQVIILPGRIVAADTQIGPRVVVEKNLPAGRYRLKQQLETF